MRQLNLLGPGPVKLFVSYSHINAAWFQKLRPLLKFRNPSANIAHVWHDQELRAGDRWHDEIQTALERMDVFVCLVSYEFLDSDYIMDIELKHALAQEQKGKVVIVPILLYDMNLKDDCPELNAFNPLPAWNKCWRNYEKDGGHYQDAHQPIRKGLQDAINKVKAKH
ncbi:toll/interleukin-1 receptor domain-containing protein [Acaryochloris marina]|uniref:toll/interleukin-1 receptor domain-containing protein n=1 Tax=Acaryochloris marina TaxID=155978 RepID=UPI001BAF7928|nr:toll/interleukin-1 receptor domain-containing protein [Acaryochloris marina]QUY41230.1 toll/interleukin-1 receptor domain-containing protein [Acaryochloris marina S15]